MGRNFFLRRWKHWLVVVALILLGEWFSEVQERNESFLALRYRTYQRLQGFGPRRAVPRFTSLVLIDDDAYWKEPSSGRVPINRRLLASIISRIAQYNPSVIALDIDLSTGDETTATPVESERHGKMTLREHHPFADETRELVETIADVLPHQVIVLSEEIGRTDGEHWTRLADVYEGFDFENDHLRTGFIQLDSDLRKLPRPLPMRDGLPVDSFSIAASRAANPALFRHEKWDHEVFAGFMESESFPQVTVSELLKSPDADAARRFEEMFAHRIVLIGGAWHKLAHGRGTELIDSHETPVGTLPGVFVHANYVEALLDGRELRLGHTAHVELPLVIASAILLSLPLSALARVAVILGVVLVPLVFSYFAVQNVGIYFDVFLIDLLLVSHLAIDKVWEWYRDHMRLHALIARGIIPAEEH
ncbi:MAG TPA: CHASE2 domain-containing protein [Planctomycetaceae bacterium]|nr:CHASE2 domain-containing protein [Planctomycetaceae bacterium]